MRSPIVRFLLLLGLVMPLAACDFGGGDAEEEVPGNIEQQDDDDDDDD